MTGSTQAGLRGSGTGGAVLSSFDSSGVMDWTLVQPSNKGMSVTVTFGKPFGARYVIVMSESVRAGGI